MPGFCQESRASVVTATLWCKACPFGTLTLSFMAQSHPLLPTVDQASPQSALADFQANAVFTLE